MKTNQIAKQLFLLLIAFIICLGCSFQKTDPAYQATDNELVDKTNGVSSNNPIDAAGVKDPVLKKNMFLWEKAGIENYDMTVSLYVGGVHSYAEPVLIKVRGGKTLSIEVSPASKTFGMEGNDLSGYQEFDTVEKMFGSIHLGLERKATVRVKYDEELGYPTELYVNYFQRGTDQYHRLVVKKLEKAKD